MTDTHADTPPPYRPGTVALATVRGVPNVRVMHTFDGDWRTGELIDGTLAHGQCDVTDVRPAIVLEIHHECAEFVTDILRETSHAWTKCVADEIERQMWKPRIPEPGWGEQVIAHLKGHGDQRQRWVSTKNGPYQEWHSETGHKCTWSSLVDPVRDPQEGMS